MTIEDKLKLWNFFDGKNELPNIVDMMIDRGFDSVDIHYHFQYFFPFSFLTVTPSAEFISNLKEAYTYMSYTKFKK